MELTITEMINSLICTLADLQIELKFMNIRYLVYLMAELMLL